MNLTSLEHIFWKSCPSGKEDTFHHRSLKDALRPAMPSVYVLLHVQAATAEWRRSVGDHSVDDDGLDDESNRSGERREENIESPGDRKGSPKEQEEKDHRHQWR